jgi:RNA polymerase sigma-70 factor (ECF subfamily)
VRVLYEHHAKRIHRQCLDRLRDRDEASDAVQDTFLRAWLAIRDGVEVRRPLPWLLTIADNVCVSRIRARGARVATTTLSDHASVELSEALGELAGLTAALRTLPDRQRQALLRRELQGYSYDEIGAELGVSRASVAALLHRARLTVAEALREARRGIAALLPIPAVERALRAPFEGGMATGAAIAGTAVVAVTQLTGAGPVPASPQPHERKAEAISATLPSRHLVAMTQASGRLSSRTAVPTAPRLGGPTPPTLRSSTKRNDAVAVLGATSLEPGGENIAHVLRRPPESPGAETAAPPETQAPPAADPAPPAFPPPAADEPATASAESPPRHTGQGDATPPGNQPRGTRGRSEHAPDAARRPERAEERRAHVPPGSAAPAVTPGKPAGASGSGAPDASPGTHPPGKAGDDPAQGGTERNATPSRRADEGPSDAKSPEGSAARGATATAGNRAAEGEA